MSTTLRRSSKKSSGRASVRVLNKPAEKRTAPASVQMLKKPSEKSTPRTSMRVSNVPSYKNAARASVRMYRHGLGDCFLLQFPKEDGAKRFNILIDCGLISVAPKPKEEMQ